jgi:hypothetical protein
MSQDSALQVSLSSSGLRRIANIDKESFCFRIGSYELTCNRCQAAFLSENVHRLLESDPNVDEFIIRDVDFVEHEISVLRSLIVGGKF